MYAESKPFDPMAKIGKTYVEIGLQACNISTKIGMDLPMTDGNDDYESRYYKRGSNKKRGRKNKYYD